MVNYYYSIIGRTVKLKEKVVLWPMDILQKYDLEVTRTVVTRMLFDEDSMLLLGIPDAEGTEGDYISYIVLTEQYGLGVVLAKKEIILDGLQA